MSVPNDRPPLRPETLAVHAGDPEPRFAGAVVPPIFRSTVFELADPDGGAGGYHDVVYPRLNNLPNHRSLGAKLAALEGAEAALPTASGMAAVSTTLLSVLANGGHLLVQEQLYGGTHVLVTGYLERYGISYDWIDANDPASWESKLRPNTRAIHVEAIANPLTRVVDPVAVVEFARAHDLVSIIDATFVTPMLLRPIEYGFDIVLHSATKYLNGHSDVVAGTIAARADVLAPISALLDELGATLDPHACFLLDRGLKTLPLRMRQHSKNGLALARALEEHPAVARVHHPGLPSHPDHALAARLFADEGGDPSFGGMLAFELTGGTDAARRALERVRIASVGPSLGGVETLATRPCTTSHAGLTAEERAALGIADGLIRVSAGIEATEDLVDDFLRAIG